MKVLHFKSVQNADIYERAVGRATEHPCFPASALAKRRALRFLRTHHVCSELGALAVGLLLAAAQTDFHHRVLLVRDWRNGQPFVSGMHWPRDLGGSRLSPSLLVTPRLL